MIYVATFYIIFFNCLIELFYLFLGASSTVDGIEDTFQNILDDKNGAIHGPWGAMAPPPPPPKIFFFTYHICLHEILVSRTRKFFLVPPVFQPTTK